MNQESGIGKTELRPTTNDQRPTTDHGRKSVRLFVLRRSYFVLFFTRHSSLVTPFMYNVPMQRFVRRLGVVPVMMLSAGLFLLGVLAVDRIINTMWLFDVTRIDLARAVVQQRADAPTLLAAANGEILIAFLASVVVTFTGLWMVPIYYLNKRLNPPDLRDQIAAERIDRVRHLAGLEFRADRGDGVL
ncbi:MAG TPA: hypothetical protein PLR07_12240, partial [Promineifilum sp.]|nr:hypothetical protein [Promineifilum sp.]